MIKPYKSVSLAVQARRKYIWQHNGYLGNVAMTRRAMDTIMGASSTTDRAKALADEIRQRCEELAQELKTRIDP